MNDVFEFEPVAESPTCGNHGILQCDAGDTDGQIAGPADRNAHGCASAGTTNTAGLISAGELVGLVWSAGASGASTRRPEASASTSTRPTACVGMRMPRRDENVDAMSTGSTC